MSQLPDGYKKKSVSSSDGEDDEDLPEVMSTDPKRCAALLFRDRATIDHRGEHMTATAHSGYGLPGDGQQLRGDISVSVTSYDEPYPLSIFDSAETSLSTCARFALNGLSVTTEALPAPDLGDRAYAFRMEYAGAGQTRDLLFVRSGHNIIRIFAKSNLPDYEVSQLEDVATTVLDNLEE